jgi:septum formation protein
MILASKSPRRAKILSAMGIDFTVEPTDAAEVSIPRAPKRTVLVNAARKLKACRENHPQEEIVAADTIVWFNGRIYGKPRDLDEAKKFLRELSGQTHSVFTGVALHARAETSRRNGGIESQIQKPHRRDY